MKKLAILGLGHIGSYVFHRLSENPNLSVRGYDQTTGHDLANNFTLDKIVDWCDGILASTPFYLNKQIASVCDKYGKDYFDLTESVEVTNYVSRLSGAKFVTQCGLAPGMVSIIANHLATQFNKVRDIQIRVGALPENANNHLGYYRTWNTEGLINEYIHPCGALKNGKLYSFDPLSEPETLYLEGQELEALTTSGGLGSLALTWQGKANDVTYKTLRYPGHWNHIRFLKDDLGLKENFDTYVQLFNKHIPQTTQDCIYIYISVDGMIGKNFVNKQYSKIIRATKEHTAIQISTGNGVMSVIDAWLQDKLSSKNGWIKQEDLDYNTVWDSKYTEVYKP